MFELTLRLGAHLFELSASKKSTKSIFFLGLIFLFWNYRYFEIFYLKGTFSKKTQMNSHRLSTRRNHNIGLSTKMKCLECNFMAFSFLL
jgi:hypothetical protein